MRDRKPAGSLLWAVLLVIATTFGFNGCGNVNDVASTTPPPPQLTITSGSPLPSGSISIAYSTTLAASGGMPGYTWSVKTGPGLENLPAGLRLSAAGVISGTPTTIETRSPVFKVVDTSPLPQVVEKALTISINAVPVPRISAPGALPNGIVGLIYSATLTATGGTPPYTTWSVSPALPNGLTFDTATATISGTPQAATGTTNHTFSVTDSFSPVPQTGTRNYSLTISPAPLTLSITTPSLPPGTVALSYFENVAAFGGTPPLTWSIVSGSLPPGLQLNQSNGAITGVPTTVGSFSPRFRVQDVGTPIQSDEKTLAITINLPAPPSITTTSLPAGSFNAAYNQTVQVTGGIGTLVWGVTSGALPPGFNLNATNGNISGTPTMTGSFSFTLRVTDQIPQFDQQNFTITINPPAPPAITAPASLPTGTVNQAYPDTTLTASGGTAPLTWDPVVGLNVLPNGLSWDADTHTISGIPLNGSQGTANHSFTVRDSTNPILTATRTYSLAIVLPAPPTITTTSASLLPNGIVTKPYSRTLQRTGGTAPFIWSFTGTLPTGLTLNTSTGVISGTPTAAGPFNFTVQITDDLSQSDTQALSITIDLPAPPNITDTSLPNGTVASAYSQIVHASGGTGALTWSISAGSLPTGLNPINPSTGQISGTPSAAGTFNFTVRATDTLNLFGDQPLSITIDLPAPPTITPRTFPNGTVGTPGYNEQVQATGGIGNLSWTIISPGLGPLPPGLDIDPNTGVISGEPTTAGSFPFRVQVTDTIPQSDTEDFSITIDP
jgi:hypothetical protein